MKHQIAVCVAGLMLLSTGCDIKEQARSLGSIGHASKKSENGIEESLSELNIQGQKQPLSRPSLKSGGVAISIDFLYWRASEDGIEYASVLKTAHANNLNSTLYKPKIKWDPGLRVALGYTLGGWDFWNLGAVWTHFQTDQKRHKSAEAFDLSRFQGKVIAPVIDPTLLGSYAVKAMGQWRLVYNVYDLNLGRDYFLSKTISMNPFVGLRGATIHQDFRAHYTTLLADGSILPTTFKADHHFWGLGGHIGTSLKWHFTNSFSFIGNIGASLLYGNFKIQQRSTPLREVGGTVTTVSRKIKEPQTTASAQLEALIGLAWQRFFYHEKQRVSFILGYEWNDWFGQNRMIQQTLTSHTTSNVLDATTFATQKGDLTLQGITFKAEWNF